MKTDQEPKGTSAPLGTAEGIARVGGVWCLLGPP